MIRARWLFLVTLSACNTIAGIREATYDPCLDEPGGGGAAGEGGAHVDLPRPQSEHPRDGAAGGGPTACDDAP